MNQTVGQMSSNYFAPGDNERLHMLNAQQAYHIPTQPSLRLVTGNLPVNPYYPADTHYDSDPGPENYMLSPATPLTPNDPYAAYGFPDNARSWPPYNSRYVSGYTRYPAYEQAQYTTELPTRSRAPNGMMTGSSGVFATQGLHMALPNPVPASISANRELPLPTVGARQQSQAHSFEVSQARTTAYSKAFHQWSGHQVAANARNGSITSSRSSEFAAPIPQKPASTTTNGSEQSPATLSASSRASPDISPTTTTAVDHVHAESFYAMPSASLSDSRLEQPGPTGNLYTFSIARRPQPGDSEVITASEDAQIGSSATYVPIPYPTDAPTGRPYSLESSRQSSTDHRVHGLAQRSSMPSIGGQES